MLQDYNPEAELNHFMPKRDQIGPKAYMQEYLNYTGGFKTTADAAVGTKSL